MLIQNIFVRQKTHIVLVHERKKLFKCEICGNKFAQVLHRALTKCLIEDKDQQDYCILECCIHKHCFILLH